MRFRVCEGDLTSHFGGVITNAVVSLGKALDSCTKVPRWLNFGTRTAAARNALSLHTLHPELATQVEELSPDKIYPVTELDSHLCPSLGMQHTEAARSLFNADHGHGLVDAVILDSGSLCEGLLDLEHQTKK